MRQQECWLAPIAPRFADKVLTQKNRLAAGFL